MMMMMMMPGQGSPLGKKFISQLATGNLFLVASTIFGSILATGIVFLVASIIFWSPVPFLVTRNISIPSSVRSVILINDWYFCTIRVCAHNPEKKAIIQSAMYTLRDFVFFFIQIRKWCIYKHSNALTRVQSPHRTHISRNMRCPRNYSTGFAHLQPYLFQRFFKNLSRSHDILSEEKWDIFFRNL